MERIAWIDRMRGIAILSVVVQHMTYYLGNEFVFHKIIGIGNMAVFFWISGYICYKASEINSFRDIFSFLWRKTIQLMVPFLMWPLIINRYVFSINWLPLSLSDVISQWHQPFLWFLLTLYGFSFVGACYRYLSCRLASNLLLGGAFLFFVMLGLIHYFTGEFKYALLYYPYYVIGLIVADKDKLCILSNKLFGTISLICICFLSCFWISGQATALNSSLKFIVSISLISVVYIVCSEFDWNNKIDDFVRKCGLFLMAIYCAHWHFTKIALNHLQIPQNEMIGLLFVLLFAIVASYSCILIKTFISYFPIVDLLVFGSMKKKTVRHNHDV